MTASGRTPVQVIMLLYCADYIDTMSHCVVRLAGVLELLYKKKIVSTLETPMDSHG